MSGFYRVDNGQLLFSTNLQTPSGTYIDADHALYAYPIDGVWNWYPDFRTACLGENFNPGMDAGDRSYLDSVYQNLSDSAKVKVLRIKNEIPE